MEEVVLIGVIGMDEHGQDEPISKEAWDTAERLGMLTAQRGAVMVTGGRGGIMEAASKGAYEAGGIVVGLLPSSDKHEANKYVNVPIATGMDEVRGYITVRSCDAVIMISGSNGTLCEATIAAYQRPLIVIQGTGGWSDRIKGCLYNEKSFDIRGFAPVYFVDTADEAIDLAYQLKK